MKRRALIRAGGAALALVGALVVLRLCLPALALRAVNKKLSALEGYTGRADRVGLGLWRGAFRLEGLRLDKKGGPAPFLTVDAVAFSLSWRALLHGRILANAAIRRPSLHIVKSEEKAGPPGPAAAAGGPSAKPQESIAQGLESLRTFEIDRVAIRDGEIRYRDDKSDPKIAVALTEISVDALNLRNTREPGVALPADVRVEAKTPGSGSLVVGVKFDPLNEKPTFELKQKLSGVQLNQLGDLIDAYAKVRVKKGVFSLNVEVAAKDGKFIGYAEPFFKDLQFETKSRKGGRKILAAAASAVKWAVSNKSKKQVATKIPIEGAFDDPKTGIWEAIGGILKNAYIKALTPQFAGLKLKDVNKVKVR